MKKRSMKKLQLNRETLRYLDPSELSQADGGNPPNRTSDAVSECVTCSCVTCPAASACPCQ